MVDIVNLCDVQRYLMKNIKYDNFKRCALDELLIKKTIMLTSPLHDCFLKKINAGFALFLFATAIRYFLFVSSSRFVIRKIHEVIFDGEVLICFCVSDQRNFSLSVLHDVEADR